MIFQKENHEIFSKSQKNLKKPKSTQISFLTYLKVMYTTIHRIFRMLKISFGHLSKCEKKTLKIHTSECLVTEVGPYFGKKRVEFF